MNYQVRVGQTTNEFYIMNAIISKLQIEVNLYQDLFGDPTTVKRLNNDSYRESLEIIRRAMLFEIISRLSALLEPAKNATDRNLSLDHLVELSKGKISKRFINKVATLKEVYKRTGLKRIRHKLLAHNDVHQLLTNKPIKTKFDFNLLINLLNEMQITVRKLGYQSGMIASGHWVARDTKLPKGRDGKTLLSRLLN